MPSHDAGNDLEAVKHNDSRVAIQCKARSGGGAVTTRRVQKSAGAAPSSVFAERWMVAEARSAATEDPAAVAAVTFVDFKAVRAEAPGAPNDARGRHLTARSTAAARLDSSLVGAIE